MICSLDRELVVSLTSCLFCSLLSDISTVLSSLGCLCMLRARKPKRESFTHSAKGLAILREGIWRLSPETGIHYWEPREN